MNKSAMPFDLLCLSGRDVSAARLSLLTGGRPSLSFRLPYVPPFGRFDVLRNLLLQIRREGEKRMPEVLILDVTEWLEHSDEEYLEIMAKYFHDHGEYRCVFTAFTGELGRAAARPVYSVLRTYMPGRLTEDRTFIGEESLTEALAAGGRTEEKAAALLARLILGPGGEAVRSHAALDTILRELEGTVPGTAGEKKITSAAVERSLADPDSLLGTLFGNVRTIKGGNAYEKAV